MINELAGNYAGYVNQNIGQELGPLEETIEDMLTRLEEFETLVDMVQEDEGKCLGSNIPEIFTANKELEKVFEKIDRLEAFVGRVKHDLDIVESHLDEAEAEAGTDGTLKNILKPLLFMKTEMSSAAKKVKSPVYEAHDIFKTDQFFHPDDSSQNKEI
ncbi:biogenesis of lysosome-related organelles complex 1 subunit 4 [Ischnura elegans]|uniref:biogenesis of lysosome-related organelles complex 1 subunit 4 n=1 Tax=Ischnura elegans TaxID=197161 RepID=UPI001ED89EF2|nr:biogenesis of lysosome-related organelles complex 1 subunit 4 [Ischnura elegans]